MDIYEIGVSRIYTVRVRWNSEEDAKRIAENFLETRDGSWSSEREAQQFEFMEMPQVVQSESWVEQKISGL